MVHTRFSSASEASGSQSRLQLTVSAKSLKKKKMKSLGKSKKLKLPANLFAPPQGLSYAIPVDQHRAVKICVLNKYEPITDLRTLLSATQLADFENSCFGKYMHMPNFKIQHQLIHNLLLRQLKQPNNNELWIGIGGITLKFGLAEFAEVTGLVCVGNVDKMRYSTSTNSFINNYYEGSSSILKSSLKKTFFGKEWKSDADAVKFAKLYFLHHFFLTSNTDNHIPKGDFDLIESDDFDTYPWGKEIFNMTLDSFRNTVKTNSKDNYYRLIGFPYALQVWFYENCPYMNGKYCDQNGGGSIPRILNWTCEYNAKYEDIYTLLSMDAKDLQLQNPRLHPNKNPRLNDNSDDDFVTPPLPSGTPATSSSIPAKDDNLVKQLQLQVRKMVASQRSLVGEVKNLKAMISEQRNQFDLELSKMRDMFLKQAGVPNEDNENLNYESNHDGFHFDDIIQDEVPTKTTEAVVVQECSDFSPKTLAEIENVLHNIDAGHSNTKQQAVVAEVEVAVAEGADKVAEHGDKFAKETVEREEFAGNYKEVEENSVLKVAHEIYESTIPDEPMDEPETAVEKASDVEMKDGGSSMSAVVKATPALPKRSIKLPSYLLSPFLQHFGSSSKEPTETTNVDHFKGISPLDSNIGVLPDLDISSEYYIWLDKGLSMNKNKRKFYSKQDNVISPPMKLGCELVSQKTWFHSIEYGSTDLSNSHVDVFFYYLRKLSKHGTQCQIKFTTPDCKFYKALSSLYYDSDVHLYSASSESDKIQSKITEKRGILDMLNGTSLPFSTPWYLADYVLVPVWLADPRHWVLAVIDLKQRFISVRNTLSGQGVSVILTKAILPLSKILPHYLLMTDFYSRTDIDFSAKCYAEPPRTHCFNTAMKNPYVCRDSLDSGVAMVSIAEYFVLAKDFPKDSFDVAIHRSRLSFSFYAYAMAKHIYEYESEQEYFNDARVEAVSKRTRAGKRQTRTRKCARKGAKASPIRIE